MIFACSEGQFGIGHVVFDESQVVAWPDLYAWIPCHHPVAVIIVCLQAENVPDDAAGVMVLLALRVLHESVGQDENPALAVQFFAEVAEFRLIRCRFCIESRPVVTGCPGSRCIEDDDQTASVGRTVDYRVAGGGDCRLVLHKH